MNNNYPLIIGNWKLNGDTKEFRSAYVQGLLELLKKPVEKVNVAICPANVHIYELSKKLSPFGLNVGSQNVSTFDTGAYTGEISATMLKELGCNLCIIGHSERREIFNETNVDCNNKIKRLHEQNILPILCIGESQNERENNATHNVLSKQLSESLVDIKITAETPLTVAYEPIWAIGSGESASPKIAQDTHLFIREQLSVLYGNDTSKLVKIIYGGSVNENNAKNLLAQNDIDGLLIGGVSLDPVQFNTICNIATPTFSVI